MKTQTFTSILTGTAVLLLLTFSKVHGADSLSAVEKGQKIRDHLNNLSSLTFAFTQRTSGQMSGRPRQASGNAYFVKHNNQAKMRWNYSAPEYQVILSDGLTLSMYFESLNQMIIAPADSLQQDVMYSFFTSKGNIEDDFVVEQDETIEKQSSEQSFEVLQLEPKSTTTQVKKITIWVTNEVQVKRIEILDSFDTYTLINMSNIEEDSLLENNRLIFPDLFTFTPPEGTEIIQQ